jgi:molecular chaperone Hsp33
MKALDQNQRFLFDEYPIRGQHVSLDECWTQIVAQSELEGRALTLLGEALAAVTLLVETLKIKGSVILQVRGTGPLGLLVVEANSDQQVRGIARQERAVDDEMTLQQLFGSEYFVITIKPGKGEPHQGIATLTGRSLAESLEHYFDTSDQLATRFWLACDKDNVSGLMLQKLPGNLSDGDAWNRVSMLADTLSMQELKLAAADSLLYRLFHQEEVRLFDARPIEFHCSCSRERSASMLLTLGKPEVLDILQQEGEVSVTCEFCNGHYRFDSIDIEQTFSESVAAQPSVSEH